jgi:hypothetical protein
VRECKYRLPCDWCDKFNKKCDEVDYYGLPDANTCKHDWVLETTYISDLDENGKFIYRGRFVCRKCHEVEVRDLE